MNHEELHRLLVVLARKAVIGQSGRSPQPGDLVVEVTSFRPDPDALGVLLGHDLAPYHEDDPLDGSVPMREVWDIRPLTGNVQPGKDYQRWENAEFRTVAAAWERDRPRSAHESGSEQGD